ncbi:MAG: lytic transglycosylase domain-containing protein, partial [Enterobacteriaceae bacterium]
MLDFFVLAAQCAADMPPQLLANIVRVESAHNPYAIGVVGGRLQRQPRNQQEAVVTAQALHRAGWN